MLKLTLTTFTLFLLPSLNLTAAWVVIPPILMVLTTCIIPYVIMPYNLYTCHSPSTSLDFLSAPLLLLTLWITALMILSSNKVIQSSSAPFSFLMLLLALMIVLMACFFTTDMLMFYIFFEASLIPTLLIILGWGYQPERLQAGIYLMMYTITASLPLLITITYMYASSSSNMMLFNHMPLVNPFLSGLWWLMCSAAFMAKMPLFLAHLWLPKAHVEAPVAGSMILAAVLLKLGSYGILRYAYIMSWVNISLAPIISSISMWGAVITALICTRQTDMKSLIAYSSVGHMGILLAGTMSNTSAGWSASLTMMLAHGLCSSAMFSLANMNYEMFSTRNMFMYKGLLSMFPLVTLFWFLASAANMAAPPTLNLLSEIILITSTLSYSLNLMTLLALMSFITAIYTLILYTSLNHGTPPAHQAPSHLILMRNYMITTLHMIPLFVLIASPLFTLMWL
nr:NADH dehydrogenase subunit 4 [Hesionides sp. PA-2020]